MSSLNLMENLKKFITNLIIHPYPISELDAYTMREKSGCYTVNHEILKDVERKIGHKLPEDYKYYCNEIGTSRTSTGVTIYAVDSTVVDMNSTVLERGIKEVNDLINMPLEAKACSGFSDEILLENLNFLKSSLMIGDFSRDNRFFFDLRTYKNEDESYGIFLYNIFSPEISPVKITRGFANFFCNFCYGKPVCDLFPGACLEVTHELFLGGIVPFV
jgi:hypothetical protein